MCRATLFGSAAFYSTAFYRAARRLGAASHRRYVLAFGMLVVLAAVPLTSGTAAAGAGPARSVRYLGRTFTVPRGWRVIDLAAHPHQCVRFDRHVLYLGAPGRVQDCPAGLVGATDAMLVQPSARRAARGGLSGGPDDHGGDQADHGHRQLLVGPGPDRPGAGQRGAADARAGQRRRGHAARDDRAAARRDRGGHPAGAAGRRDQLHRAGL
jgi:hypothetical protein